MGDSVGGSSVKVIEEALYQEGEIVWIPPTPGQMQRAFFIITPEQKLPDYVKPVTKYIIEKPNGTVNEIYVALSKELKRNDIKNALDWLDYRKFVEVIGDKYSTRPDDLQLFKEFLSRG